MSGRGAAGRGEAPRATRLGVADGVAYAVEDGGGERRPLLLLHGFTGSAATWRPHLEAFAAHARPIAVDLLGHGDSDAPPDPARHAVERQAADLGVLLERLDAAPADVLGYSFGARVALRLALDHPSVVRRLVLESPSAGIGDPVARAQRREADARWLEVLDRGDLRTFAQDWEAQAIFASHERLPPELRDRLREERLRNDPAGLAASLRGAGQGTMEPLLERLHELSVPTLVLAGGLDPVGRDRAEVVARRVPHARLEVLEDAGHTPHVETPDAFRALVTAFLTEPFVRPTLPQPSHVM